MGAYAQNSVGFRSTTLLGATPVVSGGGFPSATLTAHWTMDEAAGSRTDNKASIVLVTTNSGPAQVSGKISNAAGFTAASGHGLFCGDKAELSFGAESFTINVWVNLTTVTTLGTIVQKGAANASCQYYVEYLNGDGHFSFYVADSGSAHSAKIVSTVTTATGGWHMITATHRQGSNIGIQIDNGTEDTTAYTFGCFDDSGIFTVGADENIFFLDAAIDELSVFRSALSSGDRTTLWNSGAGLTYP